MAKSIEHFGWINPILVDEDNQVLAGHGRLLAAQHLGLTKVPIIQVTHLSIAEKHAYRLADNKLAENATWDEGLVRVELEILMDSEIDFDMDLTGFNTPEIDMYLTTSEVTDDEGGDSEIRRFPETEMFGCSVSTALPVGTAEIRPFYLH